MCIDKRRIFFYFIGLAMCHPLELIFNTYRFTHFYLIGLAIYLITFTIIWRIISKREYTFLQLLAIGSLVGFLVEMIIVREIGQIVPLIIVSVAFWGLLYTAVNYTIVKHVSNRFAKRSS